MKSLSDLITTTERLKIYMAIITTEGTFTIKDIRDKLEAQGTTVGIITIQLVLQGMVYRGHLERTRYKAEGQGRPPIRFRGK